MKREGRRKRIGMIAAAIAVLLLCGGISGKAEGLNVRRIGKIISYTDNAFAVEAPEAGHLTITLRDDYSVFRVLEEELNEGENEIHWDGCGYNREQLAIQNYHIDCRLEGKSGTVYDVTFDSPVEYSGQALEFALPSGKTVYLNRKSEWFLETSTVVTGNLTVEFYEAGSETPALTSRKDSKGGKIGHFTYAQLTGKKNLAPGAYHVRVFESSKPDEAVTFPLTVAEGAPEDAEIPLTGDIMPGKGSGEEEILEAMRKPAVVVDLGYTDHQQVYQDPDGMVSLGTLHGETQCVSVLEKAGDWARIGAWNHEEGEYIEGWVPLKKLKIAEVQTEYGLVVDKEKQTMTLYHDGKRIGTLFVSTGRMETNELYQETAAGSFLTGLHRVDYSTQGMKYDYVIQYDGGNLMHQIPYAWGGKKDFTAGRSMLGAKGSHACIRIQAEPEAESGINAYWIWTHIPYHTRILILDDAEERRNEKNRLTGNVPTLWTDENETESAEAEPPAETDIVMTFLGDCVIGGRESYYNRTDSMIAYLNEKGMGYPFSGLLSLTEKDDLTSANLECVLKETRAGEDTKKEWRFRGLPAYTEILKKGSVELVNLANNHTIDYGEEGYQSTVAAVEKDFLWCGKNHVCQTEIKGHKIGFGGLRETEYLQDPDRIGKDIQELKEAGCEYIIYQCHWGEEYSPLHSGLQEAIARACQRAGADLVIGHHPHVVQGIGMIDGMPVIYSLGNLVFGGTIDLRTYDAMAAQVIIHPERETDPIEIRLIPILTSSSAGQKINDYRPSPAEGEDRKRILNAVQADTPFSIGKWSGAVSDPQK